MWTIWRKWTSYKGKGNWEPWKKYDSFDKASQALEQIQTNESRSTIKPIDFYLQSPGGQKPYETERT